MTSGNTDKLIIKFVAVILIIVSVVATIDVLVMPSILQNVIMQYPFAETVIRLMNRESITDVGTHFYFEFIKALLLSILTWDVSFLGEWFLTAIGKDTKNIWRKIKVSFISAIISIFFYLHFYTKFNSEWITVTVFYAILLVMYITTLFIKYKRSKIFDKKIVGDAIFFTVFKVYLIDTPTFICETWVVINLLSVYKTESTGLIITVALLLFFPIIVVNLLLTFCFEKLKGWYRK